MEQEVRLIDAAPLIADGWVLEKHGVSNCVIGRRSLADVPVVELVEKQVLFLCDRRMCKTCDPSCNHTSDVSHARNFKLVGSVFVEGGAAE